MFRRNYLLSFFHFVILGATNWAFAEVDTCADTHEILSRFQFRDPYVSIPIRPAIANDLAICRPGTSCCTRTLEQQLMIKARHDYHASVQSSVSYLKYTLSTAVVDFQGEYEDLLQFGEDRVNQHLSTNHPNFVSRMRRSLELLFIDLQTYLQGHVININRSIEDFFDELFPHVYSAYMNVGRLSSVYMQCLSRERASISPFGHEDNRLSHSLQDSLKLARALLQSVDLGAEVLNSTEHMRTTRKCRQAVTRMRYCPYCQGVPYARPCNSLCMNVMKGCLANYMDLDIYWSEYVTTVVNVIRQSMSAEYDLQQIMHSLDDRIDRAIQYAVNHKDDITHAVLERCGPPPQMRPNSYTDYAVNSPPINIPIAPSSGIPLDERLLNFVHTLDNSRGMFRNLPGSLCLDGTMSSVADVNCWNGRNMGSYTEEVVGDGTVAQQWNPEVPLTGREPELVDALLLMEKLQRAAKKTKGLLESFDEGDDDDIDDYYVFSGSGSGADEGGSGCDDSDDEDCSYETSGRGQFQGRMGSIGTTRFTPTVVDTRFIPTRDKTPADDPNHTGSRQEATEPQPPNHAVRTSTTSLPSLLLFVIVIMLVTKCGRLL